MAREVELSTKVEGNPSVYAQLEAKRAAEVRATREAPLASAGVVCWKQMQTTRHNTLEDMSPAAARHESVMVMLESDFLPQHATY